MDTACVQGLNTIKNGGTHEASGRACVVACVVQHREALQPSHARNSSVQRQEVASVGFSVGGQWCEREEQRGRMRCVKSDQQRW